MAPSNFSSVPNSIVSSYDLAGKRKRNSPSKRRDSNETGPSTTYTPTGAKATRRRITKVLSFKGSKFAYSDLESSLDLDHWDRVIDDYLGTDSEIVYNSQTFSNDSSLDQSGRTLASETAPQTTSTSPAGTSDNPIRIESSLEKNTEVPPVDVPKGSEPATSQKRSRPPRTLRRQAIHHAFVIRSGDHGNCRLRRGTPDNLFRIKKPSNNIFLDYPSDYLTPLEDILPQPTLVAETTQGSTSFHSSTTPNIAVLSSLLVEGGLDIQDDEGSDISSVIETEVRKDTDSLHEAFNPTS